MNDYKMYIEDRDHNAFFAEMTMQTILFDGSIAVGVARNEEAKRIAITLVKLPRKYKPGEKIYKGVQLMPMVALEFETDRSIDVLVGQLEYVKNHKYHMFENTLWYNGICVEA